jgi:ketosteroid isomerase-like protein
MKEILLAVFVSLVNFNFVQAQTSKPVAPQKIAVENQRDKQELIRLTNEILRASVEDDAATLERLMDDNFVMFHSGNKSNGKAQLIKRWTAKSSDTTASSSSTAGDFQVFLYGDTAIVVSKITDVDRNKEGEKTIRTFVFDVWKRTGKTWRWIASRETLLPE